MARTAHQVGQDSSTGEPYHVVADQFVDLSSKLGWSTMVCFPLTITTCRKSEFNIQLIIIQ